MGSAEREAERLDAWIEKLDFELAVDDRALLPDQLIGALFGHNAAALLIDVSAVRRTGRLPGEANDKSRRGTGRGFDQQLLNAALRLVVCPLPKMGKPNRALGIEQVERRPVLVRKAIPDGVVVVDRNRILHAHRRDRTTHVLHIALESKLGRVS